MEVWLGKLKKKNLFNLQNLLRMQILNPSAFLPQQVKPTESEILLNYEVSYSSWIFADAQLRFRQ